MRDRMQRIIDWLALPARRGVVEITYFFIAALAVVILLQYQTISNLSAANCRAQQAAAVRGTHLAKVMVDLHTLAVQPRPKGAPPETPKQAVTLRDITRNLAYYTHNRPRTNRKC